jgi:hypothetical protein
MVITMGKLVISAAMATIACAWYFCSLVNSVPGSSSSPCGSSSE